MAATATPLHALPMNITQHTDYALRVLMYLGAVPERRVTIKEVAERFDISRSHLMKIVTELVAKGFVDGARGKGGGLRLARAASEIGHGGGQLPPRNVHWRPACLLVDGPQAQCQVNRRLLTSRCVWQTTVILERRRDRPDGRHRTAPCRLP